MHQDFRPQLHPPLGLLRVRNLIRHCLTCVTKMTQQHLKFTGILFGGDGALTSRGRSHAGGQGVYEKGSEAPPTVSPCSEWLDGVAMDVPRPKQVGCLEPPFAILSQVCSPRSGWAKGAQRRFEPTPCQSPIPCTATAPRQIHSDGAGIPSRALQQCFGPRTQAQVKHTHR